MSQLFRTTMVTLFCTAIMCMMIISVAGEDTSTNQDQFLKDLSLSVLNTQTEHEYFTQAAANAAGQFILVARYTNIRENQDLVFRMHYIDIFDSDGSFVQELSFLTEASFVAGITETHINLYFYDCVVSYELATQIVHYQAVLPGEFIENGTFKDLQSSSFSVGEWEYRCKKGFHGYTQLTRESGSGVEILASFPGNGYTIWNTLGAAALGALLILAIVICIKKRKQASA